MLLNSSDYHEIVAMHQFCRPHWSTVEQRFIDRFILPLGVSQDWFGNCLKLVGPGLDAPKILWSCHTDTVHHRAGKQQLALYDKRWLALPSKAAASNCLGADDTAGVWMLMQMIRQGIPGLYVFHRGEERGCQGSKWLLKNFPDVFQGIQAAIAFDRAGTTDIIHHQMGKRCASQEFVASLAEGLGMEHTGSHGMYTDTATYMDTIPECSNISVGYDYAHGPHEELDLDYIAQLRDAVFALDLGKLVIARDPKKTDYEWWKPKGTKRYPDVQPDFYGVGASEYSGEITPTTATTTTPSTSANGTVTTRAIAHGGSGTGAKIGKVRPKGKEQPKLPFGGNDNDADKKDRDVLDVPSWEPQTRLIALADLCRDYPEETADYLEQLGCTTALLRDHIDSVRGMSLKRLHDVSKDNEAEGEETRQ